jgi:hypothetical protein
MNKFEKLIELIVNEDNKQAKALFHDIVVEKSRTIYESLLDEDESEEVEDMEDEVDADEEGMKESLDVTVEEAKQLLDHIDGTLNESDAGDLLQRVAEHFGVQVEGLIPVLESHGDALLEMAYGEADDEDEGELDGEEEFGGELDGDADYASDDDFGGEEEAAGEDEIEDRVVDLEDAIDELKAEFDALIGDDGMEDDFGGEEEFGGEMDDVEDFGADVSDEEDFEESLVREYVEKVSPKVTTQEEDSPNTKSTVAGKNDMGGTTANILGDQSEEAGGKAESPKDVDSRASNWKNTGGKGTKNSKTEKAPKPTNKTDSEKSILDKPQG